MGEQKKIHWNATILGKPYDFDFSKCIKLYLDFNIFSWQGNVLVLDESHSGQLEAVACQSKSTSLC